MTTLGHTLSGCANGHPVRIDGRGTVTPKQVRVRFAATDAPVTFAAGLAHFAGLDAVMAVLAGLVQAPDGLLVARCRTDLLGEGGADLGTMAAVATVARAARLAHGKAQLREALGA